MSEENCENECCPPELEAGYDVGVFGRFCLDCQYSLQQLPNQCAEHVLIGHTEYSKTDEFYKSVLPGKFVFYIGTPVADSDFTKMRGEFDVPLEMVYSIPKDRSNQLLFMIQKMSQVYVALSSVYTKWQSGGNRTPTNVSHGPIEYKRYVPGHNILVTTFKLSSKFIPDQASDPFLVPPVS